MNNKVWKILFFVYIILVINFIVVKFDGNIQEVINTIQSNKWYRKQGVTAANLVPFRTIKSYIEDLSYGVSYMNILGNIIPFIPMGFLIPMAFPSQRNIIITMFSCFLLILSVEILQRTLYLGSFDVDDIILNLLSCFIGFIIYKAYKNIFRVVPGI